MRAKSATIPAAEAAEAAQVVASLAVGDVNKEPEVVGGLDGQHSCPGLPDQINCAIVHRLEEQG